MKSYRIELRPLTKFFFGGDTTFQNERQSYYSKSEYYPQQTMLLGMLRYEVLKYHQLLEAAWDKKAEVIGKNFDADASSSYGYIGRLSPIHLADDTHYYVPIGYDFQQISGSTELRPLNFEFEGDTLTKSEYDTKKGLPLLLGKYSKNDLEFVKQPLAIHELFTQHEQVGVNKNEKLFDGKELDEEDAFFKSVLLSFKKSPDSYNSSLHYVCWVELEESALPLNTEMIVALGRESLFKMTISEEPCPTFSPAFSKQERYVLASPAYVENLHELHQIADFVVGPTQVPFVYFKQPTAKNYYKGAQERLSKQYYLLDRGTVIYGKELPAIQQLLRQNPSFEAIGYNQLLF